MPPVFVRNGEPIEVFPPVADTDEWGNDIIRPGDPEQDQPVVVYGIVQPMTESADWSAGPNLLSIYRIITERWPWQATAIVRWRGQLWDVKENPARRPYSGRTSHDSIYIRAKEVEMHGTL